jgi:hypothetical protein
MRYAHPNLDREERGDLATIRRRAEPMKTLFTAETFP